MTWCVKGQIISIFYISTNFDTSSWNGNKFEIVHGCFKVWIFSNSSRALKGL